MAVKSCTVSVKDHREIWHAVEVSAESLYEAAVQAFVVFRRLGWTDRKGPATRLVIEVREPSSKHFLSVKQVETWLRQPARNPRDKIRKDKLRQLLAGS